MTVCDVKDIAHDDDEPTETYLPTLQPATVPEGNSV